MDENQTLQGIRILSLALNLPGPAALYRCRLMGAYCTKLEPPPEPGQTSADPMALYCPDAYSELHREVRVITANLKTDAGQQLLQQELVQTDVLLTSFRPPALQKLGLSWDTLHALYPELCVVSIQGDIVPEACNHPGHDLTYQAQAGLVVPGKLPPSLFADMAGATIATEAILQTLLQRLRTNAGAHLDIGLAQAAQWLALPLHWGLTASHGQVGGAHAGYGVYATADGYVAVAALEPHFARALCAVAGFECDGTIKSMQAADVHNRIREYLQATTGPDLERIASERDIPLHLITKTFE